MGRGKNEAPEPPDPMQTAQAQTQYGVGSALVNQLLGQTNQQTPFGTLRYKQRGTMPIDIGGTTYDIPRFKAITKLSPEQQRLMDTQGAARQNLADAAAGASGRLGALLGKPMDLKGAPKVNAPGMQTVGGGPKLQKNYQTDFSADRQKVEDALMSRLNPQLDRDRASMEASLAAKGIAPGSAAFDRSMDELNRTSTDARMQAILAGGQEQSRLAGLTRDEAMFGNAAKQQMYGNRVGAAGFNNQAAQQGFENQQSMRQNWLNEQFGLRNQSLNEVGGLLGTGQVQSPNFVNTPAPQMPTTDFGGIQANNYNAQMQAWQQQQQNGQGLLGGLFGLGSSAILGWPFG